MSGLSGYCAANVGIIPSRSARMRRIRPDHAGFAAKVVRLPELCHAMYIKQCTPYAACRLYAVSKPEASRQHPPQALPKVARRASPESRRGGGPGLKPLQARRSPRGFAETMPCLMIDGCAASVRASHDRHRQSSVSGAMGRISAGQHEREAVASGAGVKQSAYLRSPGPPTPKGKNTELALRTA